MQQILHGDCLNIMAQMKNNSIDFIVTDAPYGFKFMNKKWDYNVPSVNCWKEVLRIVKPGSWIAVFGGTRTYHRTVLNVEDAGFEIRDCINWIYGSGFPKSHNKFGFEGYGTALKPAHELILLAMKPLDGTFAQNAEKWGVAGINIESSRIPSELPEGRLRHGGGKHSNKIGQLKPEAINSIPSARWPANIILDEEAAQELDEMTGILKTGSMKPQLHEKKNSIYFKWKQASLGQKSSSGGASRFFYCAKASTAERNRGLDKTCSHPTVKPISLMKYIIKLLAPPGSPILLDPFCGSGSTLVAAKELAISAIGIEKEEEYVEIAQKRIDAAKFSTQMGMFDGS